MIHISAIIFCPLWGRLYILKYTRVCNLELIDFGCYNVTDRSYSGMAVKHGSTVTCSIVSNQDYRTLAKKGGLIFAGGTVYIDVSQVVRLSLSRLSITFMGVPDVCLLNYVCTIYSRI